MSAAGTRAPSKSTSPNSVVMPLIIRSGRCSMPRLVHRHGEGGDALVLRHVVVGAGQHEAPVGHVGVARPDLVAGDDVLVAVAVGPGAERREVGAGVGFAEALAPALAAVDDPRQEPPTDVVAAVLEDPLHEVAEARARRGAGGGQLVVEDHVVDGGQLLAADVASATTARRSRRRRAAWCQAAWPCQ